MTNLNDWQKDKKKILEALGSLNELNSNDPTARKRLDAIHDLADKIKDASEEFFSAEFEKGRSAEDIASMLIAALIECLASSIAATVTTFRPKDGRMAVPEMLRVLSESLEMGVQALLDELEGKRKK